MSFPTRRAATAGSRARSTLPVLEPAALALSMSYLFEIVDTVSRREERPHAADPNYLPKVAVQLPAYNEPLEVMRGTLTVWPPSTTQI